MSQRSDRKSGASLRFPLLIDPNPRSGCKTVAPGRKPGEKGRRKSPAPAGGERTGRNAALGKETLCRSRSSCTGHRGPSFVPGVSRENPKTPGGLFAVADGPMKLGILSGCQEKSPMSSAYRRGREPRTVLLMERAEFARLAHLAADGADLFVRIGRFRVISNGMM